jgi:transposase InsO family protein
MHCVHDQGTAFIGAELQDVLMHAGIKDVPTTVRNPQANAVCKKLHQSVANILWILLSQNPPAKKNIANVGELVDAAIATSLQ